MHTNAAEIPLTEIPWNFFQENWVYMWQKILDEEKVEEYRLNYIRNYISGMSDDYPYKVDISRINQSMYYPIKINWNYNITSVKDYEWKDINFTQTWDTIRIYYDSFLNSFGTWIYDTENLILKDYSPYHKSPKQLTISDSEWNSTTINFQFFSSIANFNQQITQWNTTYIIKEDDNLNISLSKDYNNADVKLFALKYFIPNFNNYEKIIGDIINEKNIKININYDIIKILNLNSYDFSIISINTFSKKSCDPNYYWYNSRIAEPRLINDPNDLEIQTKFENELLNTFYWANIELSKSEWGEFVPYTNVSTNTNITQFDQLEDWLYKYKITNLDTEYKRICANHFNSSDININYGKWNYFLFVEWNIHKYNSPLDWDIINLEEFLSEHQIEQSNYFNVSLKDFEWEVIASIDKDCFLNWSCNFKNNVDNYLYDIDPCEKANLSISYKDYYNEIDLNNEILLWSDCSLEPSINEIDFFTDDFYMNYKIDIENIDNLNYVFYDKNDNIISDVNEFRSEEIEEAYANTSPVEILWNIFYWTDPWYSSFIWIKNDSLIFDNIWKIVVFNNWTEVWTITFNSEQRAIFEKIETDNDLKGGFSLRENISIESKKIIWKNFENLIFNRKLKIDLSRFEETYNSRILLDRINLKLDLINKINVTNIDKSKLFVCRNAIGTQEQFDNIENMFWCYDLKSIEEDNTWFYYYKEYPGIFNLYIYWKKWLVNEDFKNFDVNFKLFFSKMNFTLFD